VFGFEVWALRLPSYLFGVLCIPAAAFLARDLLRSRACALVAAFLVTTSPVLVGFSAACRGYAPLLLFTMLATWLLLRALEGQGSRNLPLLALALLGAGFSHMSGVAFAGTLAFFSIVYLLVRRRFPAPEGEPRRRVLLATLIVPSLLLLAWYSRGSNLVADIYNRLVHREFVNLSLAGLQSVEAPTTMRRWIQWTMQDFLGVRSWWLVAGGLLAIIGAPLALKRHARGAVLLLSIACLPILGFLVADLRPSPRYFLFVQPFALFLIATSLCGIAGLVARLLRRGPEGEWLLTTLVVLICSLPPAKRLHTELTGPGTDYLGIGWDLQGALDQVAESIEPGDVILTSPLFEDPERRRGFGFHQAYPFHFHEQLAPILYRESVERPECRLWYLSPWREVLDRSRLPDRIELELVGEHPGCFVHEGPLVGSPAGRTLPHAPGTADWIWEVADGEGVLVLEEGSGGVRFDVMVDETQASLTSPPRPVEPGSIVRLSSTLDGGERHGWRRQAEIGIEFLHESGQSILSAWRMPLRMGVLGGPPQADPIRLDTVVPGAASSMRVFLRTGIGNRAGDTFSFTDPRIESSRPANARR
jgi:hypothetical protein